MSTVYLNLKLQVSSSCIGHPEFSRPFQYALNRYRIANGSMTQEELHLAEASMEQWPVSEENAAQFAKVLQSFLKQEW